MKENYGCKVALSGSEVISESDKLQLTNVGIQLNRMKLRKSAIKVC